MEKSNKTIEYLKTIIDNPNVQSPSPAGSWLEPVLKEVTYGAVTVAVKVRPEMLNTHQTLHGGMICLMLDEAFGVTVYSLERDEAFVTINLNTDYITAAQLGDTVLLKTEVTRNGRTVINLIAKAYVEDRLIATCTSVLVTTGKPATH